MNYTDKTLIGWCIYLAAALIIAGGLVHCELNEKQQFILKYHEVYMTEWEIFLTDPLLTFTDTKEHD